MNRDESQLYVAVTRGNCVWRVPFVGDGGVAKVGLHIQLSGGGGPDGLALDEEGGLIVAHVGMGSVWTFSSLGEPVHRIKSCMGTHTTECRLRLAGPRYAVHHGIRQRDHSQGATRCAGEAHVLAYLRCARSKPEISPPRHEDTKRSKCKSRIDVEFQCAELKWSDCY